MPPSWPGVPLRAPWWTRSSARSRPKVATRTSRGPWRAGALTPTQGLTTHRPLHYPQPASAPSKHSRGAAWARGAASRAEPHALTRSHCRTVALDSHIALTVWVGVGGTLSAVPVGSVGPATHAVIHSWDSPFHELVDALQSYCDDIDYSLADLTAPGKGKSGGGKTVTFDRALLYVDIFTVNLHTPPLSPRLRLHEVCAQFVDAYDARIVWHLSLERHPRGGGCLLYAPPSQCAEPARAALVWVAWVAVDVAVSIGEHQRGAHARYPRPTHPRRRREPTHQAHGRGLARGRQRHGPRGPGGGVAGAAVVPGGDAGGAGQDRRPSLRRHHARRASRRSAAGAPHAAAHQPGAQSPCAAHRRGVRRASRVL
jgi:hypothetical protein